MDFRRQSSLRTEGILLRVWGMCWVTCLAAAQAAVGQTYAPETFSPMTAGGSSAPAYGGPDTSSLYSPSGPQSAFGPPQSAFSPPQSAFNPPQSGYGPPANGYYPGAMGGMNPNYPGAMGGMDPNYPGAMGGMNPGMGLPQANGMLQPGELSTLNYSQGLGNLGNMQLSGSPTGASGLWRELPSQPRHLGPLQKPANGRLLERPADRHQRR